MSYLSLQKTIILRAVSLNFNCALFYNPSTPELNVYSFDIEGEVTAFKTLDSSLFNGINPVLGSTKYEVSDDCNAVRMADNIFHYDATNSVYVLDTYPSGTTTLVNPVFSDDFSLAITDSGIYSYIPKNGSTPGIYNLDRA